jgi:hypothetical protein
MTHCELIIVENAALTAELCKELFESARTSGGA